MKITTSILLSLFMMLASTLAQKPLVHPKRVYRSPEGRLYVQKSMPIYVKMATSPADTAGNVLLKSEATTKYSNPMYFDTEGYNTIRSPWAVDSSTHLPIWPKTDIIFEVYADSKPPQTNINFSQTSIFEINNKTYVKDKFEISFSAKDLLSGVENTYYSINGENFTKYFEPVVLDQEKEYSMKFYSVDNVGNVEGVSTKNMIIDYTSPKTSLHINGDEYKNTISGRSGIVLEAEDATGVKNILYSIDGNPEKKYKSVILAKYLNEGEHRIEYYSVDLVNNQEQKHIYDFYIDKTPPTIVEEMIGKTIIVGGKEYSSGRSKLKLITIDNKAGVKEAYYSINGGEYQLYEKPFYLSSNSGNLQIITYAIDNVNNKSSSSQQSSKTSIPYIDLSGPSLMHKYVGPVFLLRDTVYISDKTKISLFANDTESGFDRIEYSIDGKDIKAYTQPISIEEKGLHKISFIGYDKVENTNEKSIFFLVDNQGPEIFSRFSVENKMHKKSGNTNIEMYPNHVVLFVASTDDYVGYNKMYYKVNGGEERIFYGSIKNFIKNKDYTIQIKSVDMLGNQTSKEIIFSTED